MFYRKESNQYILEGVQFTIDEVTYPSSWLNQSTPEQKVELGLEEVITINQPANGEYYWTQEVLEEATRSYTNTAKDLAVVKLNSIDKINNMVFTLLQPSDYIDVRNLRDSTYKPEWIVWRDSIRAYAKNKVSFINAALDVTSVEALMNSLDWPQDPNYKEIV